MRRRISTALLAAALTAIGAVGVADPAGAHDGHKTYDSLAICASARVGAIVSGHIDGNDTSWCQSVGNGRYRLRHLGV